jgi:hypothetical protein
MLKWLEAAFTPKNRFTIPKRSCSFPVGLLENFAESIRCKTGPLYLVVEIKEKITACGGIFVDSEGETTGLMYGVVHRDHQRRGFGTALLLARVSVLPKPQRNWDSILTMTTAGPSASFYQRFGFRLKFHYVHPFGPELDYYDSRLNDAGWEDCSQHLARSPVAFDKTNVTVPDIPRSEVALRR